MKYALLALAVLSTLAQGASITVAACDTLSVTSQTTDVVTLACGHNPPPAPAAVQSAPPPSAGTNLPWIVEGNSRTYLEGVGATALVPMYFVTPDTVGATHTIQGVYEGGSQAAMRRWTIKTADGTVIADANGQSPAFHVVVGPTQGFMAGPVQMISAYGLQPSTTYYFDVQNACAPPSVTSQPCNFLVDMNSR